jgi:hypothetical protein
MNFLWPIPFQTNNYYLVYIPQISSCLPDNLDEYDLLQDLFLSKYKKKKKNV